MFLSSFLTTRLSISFSIRPVSGTSIADEEDERKPIASALSTVAQEKVDEPKQRNRAYSDMRL